MLWEKGRIKAIGQVRKRIGRGCRGFFQSSCHVFIASGMNPGMSSQISRTPTREGNNQMPVLTKQFFTPLPLIPKSYEERKQDNIPFVLLKPFTASVGLNIIKPFYVFSTSLFLLSTASCHKPPPSPHEAPLVQSHRVQSNHIC